MIYLKVILVLFTDQDVEQAAKKAAAAPFQAMASYDAEGDCLEFFASNESCYAKSIDPLVTVYLCHAGNAPVGFRLKKVKQFLNQLLP